MKNAQHSPPIEWLESINSRWERAKLFFKERSPVVFISDGHFWEPHGFVQQSLAYTLAREGIEVVWIDGAGWRSYHPHVEPKMRNLFVTCLFQLPFRRVPLINNLSVKLQARRINSFLQRRERAPFFWVFGGMEEALVGRLPSPDVYSVFDNPYSNLPDGGLCQRSKLIVTQNTFSQKLFATRQAAKVTLNLPPVSLPDFSASHSGVELPTTFPKQVMGYVGTFMAEGINFSLIEEALIQLPEWGVLLVGRSDVAGAAKLERFKRFSNFHRVPWVSRQRALDYWRAIDVAFFPYSETMAQDGAFAVKSLEALYFNRPVVATKVPKTEDLSALISFVRNVGELRAFLESPKARPTEILSPAFWELAMKMSPKIHLAQIAESLG